MDGTGALLKRMMGEFGLMEMIGWIGTMGKADTTDDAKSKNCTIMVK